MNEKVKLALEAAATKLEEAVRELLWASYNTRSPSLANTWKGDANHLMELAQHHYRYTASDPNLE